MLYEVITEFVAMHFRNRMLEDLVIHAPGAIAVIHEDRDQTDVDADGGRFGDERHAGGRELPGQHGERRVHGDLHSYNFV